MDVGRAEGAHLRHKAACTQEFSLKGVGPSYTNLGSSEGM